jgi:hypothetical protein
MCVPVKTSPPTPLEITLFELEITHRGFKDAIYERTIPEPIAIELDFLVLENKVLD